jgi:hypothetical protein
VGLLVEDRVPGAGIVFDDVVLVALEPVERGLDAAVGQLPDQGREGARRPLRGDRCEFRLGGKWHGGNPRS